MTTEAECEKLRVPDLRLAQKVFDLSKVVSGSKNAEEITADIMKGIEENTMAKWYEYLGQQGVLEVKNTILVKLQEKVNEKVKELDERIEIAEKEEGDSDVRDAMLDRAEFLAKTGDRVGAIAAFRQIRRKCHVTTGLKLDLIFHQLRLALFYGDDFKDDTVSSSDEEEKEDEEKLSKKKDKKKKTEKDRIDEDESQKPRIKNPHSVSENIEEATRLIEEGGDWDRRNRLKVYEGLYLVQIREFKQAAKLFLDAVPTFTSYEVMSYADLVTYAVITSMVSVSRKSLKKDLIDGSDVQEQLYGLSDMKAYLNTFYNCQYDQFFISLAAVETKLKQNRYFHEHTQYYIREMRLAAYRQLLASYSSLAIDYMADAFGVNPEFIDEELARFIAADRLSAKIDHVGGIVVTNRPDEKNQQYQQVIKKGDSLLNRIQKLSRVINI